MRNELTRKVDFVVIPRKPEPVQSHLQHIARACAFPSARARAA